MVKAASKSSLTWVPASAARARAANKGTIEALRHLIRKGARKAVAKAVGQWTPENVVDLLVHLPMKAARKLLDMLPNATSSRVLSELRPQYRATITAEKTIERLRDLILGMSPEDALETYQSLPDDVQDRLAPDLKTFDSIQASRAFDKESAGEIMQRRLVALPQERTTAEVVSANTDQEEAARAAAGTAFKSLPVVDQDGWLIGEITRKMLERVVAEEAAEDMMKLGGVAEDARATDSVPRIVRNRLPWLLAGLIGATCATLIIGSFEDELAKAAILAAFIPVVMSMAGNSGLQASVVSVQALAMGGSWPGDRLIYRFARELMGALLNGAVAGSILAARILVGLDCVRDRQSPRLAMATSLSLLSVTTIAAIVGAFVPLVLHRVGIDPAAATGVFITTSNDVLSVLVYFLMASAFYF